MQPPATKLDELLDNAAWVHALARQLLADAGAADDVAQETWIAALQAGASGAGLRPWLARVARNFALQRRRADASRAVRERATARPERTPPTSEVVERAELHAKLVAAVLALEEPHRSTILWRYFEDLPPEEIARRAGIELATVRSRLKRARERLREDLIAQGGTPPEQWLAALLPLGIATNPLVPRVATTGAPLGVIGGLAMSTKLAALGVAAALVALVGWWAWSERSVELANAPTNANGVEDVALAGAENSALATDPAADSRAEVAGSEENANAAASTLTTLRGVVLGEDGRRPLSGARVSHRRGSELEFGSDRSSSNGKPAIETRTDDAGHFEIEAPTEAAVGLWFEFAGYLPLKLSAEDLPRETGRAIEAVLAPLGTIDVRVVDDQGAAAPDVRVARQVTLDRGSNDQRWSFRSTGEVGRTDGEGRITIDRVPCGMPVSLYAGRIFIATVAADGPFVIDVDTRHVAREIRLPRSAELRARLVDGASRPVASVSACWNRDPLDLNALDRICKESDADGWLVMPDLIAGSGRLCFRIPGVEPIRLELQAGEQRDLGVLVVGDLLPLSGKLTSAIAPLHASLSVRAFRGAQQLCELRPERDGSFATNITDGELQVFVMSGGYSPYGDTHPDEILACLELPRPATNLVIPIDVGRGAICASVKGVAMPAGECAWLRVWRRASDEGTGQLRHNTSAWVEPSADGRVTIGPLDPGRYVVHAELQYVGKALTEELTVQVGQVTDAGELDFHRGAIAGRVVDAASHAVAKASLWLRGSGMKAQQLLSDEDGRFRFNELWPGFYDIGAKHAEAGVVKLESIAVAGQQTTEITLVMRAFANVQGVVRDAQGPLAGVEVFLQPQRSNDDWNTTTDAEGRFRFEGLPAGGLRLWISKHVMYPIDVAPGETRELDIDLSSRASVRFTQGGNALEGVSYVYAGWGERWNIGTPVDGRVEIGSSSDTTLFMVVTDRLASNEHYVALAPHVFGSMDIELPSRELVLESAGAWRGPLPTAVLVSFGHGEVIGAWGQAIGLAVERASDGRVRVPHLPEGAVVKLEGLDSKGRHVERTVDTGADLVTHLSWP